MQFVLSVRFHNRQATSYHSEAVCLDFCLHPVNAHLVILFDGRVFLQEHPQSRAAVNHILRSPGTAGSCKSAINSAGILAKKWHGISKAKIKIPVLDMQRNCTTVAIHSIDFCCDVFLAFLHRVG